MESMCLGRDYGAGYIWSSRGIRFGGASTWLVRHPLGMRGKGLMADTTRYH
jgi:hypothetical protein